MKRKRTVVGDRREFEIQEPLHCDISCLTLMHGASLCTLMSPMPPDWLSDTPAAEAAGRGETPENEPDEEMADQAPTK